MDSKATQRQAAEMLLDVGIRIPIIPLKIFGKKKGKSSLVMHRPPTGAIIRIALRYLKLGVTPEEIKEMEYDARLKFVAEKGKAVSEIVALSICTGWITGWLFVKPVAWYIRWRVHPAMLTAALMQLLSGMDVQAFCNTIPLSARAAKLLEPIGSHEERMS